LSPAFPPPFSNIYLLQIQKLKAESKLSNIKTAVAPAQAAPASVNKKTGAPFYVMQTQKSAAHLYKEARLNKMPYTSESIPTSSPAGASVSQTGSFLSKIWMPILAMGVIAASIEAAVVYAKDAGSSSISTATNTISSDADSTDIMMASSDVVSHSQVYTESTATLIQGVLTDQESRSLRTSWVPRSRM
jgi:hypothetical protein